MDFNRDATLSFIDFAQQRGVSFDNPAAIAQSLAYYENEYVRQGNPFGPRSSTGKIYDSGPWTWFSGDIISDVSRGGSPLLRWLPTRAVTERYETVSHLSWIAPEGFTGTGYSELLDQIGEPGECDYGPSPKFDTCQYTIPFGCMSATSQTMTLSPDWLGQRDYQRSPIYRFRGNDAGLPMQNDAEFGAAQATLMFEMHMNWELVNGVWGKPYQADGLSEVISTGYVQDHKVGEGACDWSDPLIVDASLLATPDDVLASIRGMVRMLRDRAFSRNMVIAPGDMAIGMPAPLWSLLADRIPVGGLYPAPTMMLVGGNTPETAEMYRQRLMRGGMGFGFMPIDGEEIPILPINEMDSARNLLGDTRISGDIYVLTRRAGGMTLLENQFLDYGALPANVPNRQFQLAQGGIMRFGWLEYNQKCYKYFIEACHRLVSYFQPLQGRITGVTVDTLTPYTLESNTYTDAFYPRTVLGPGV